MTNAIWGIDNRFRQISLPETYVHSTPSNFHYALRAYLLSVQPYFTRRAPELPYWNLITALSNPVLEDIKAYCVPIIPDMWQVAA